MKFHRAGYNSNFLTTLLSGLALIASVHVASAQTAITTNLMAPPGFVDTTVPGFKMYIVQEGTPPENSPLAPLALSAAARAESLIAGKAIDSKTGLPFVNAATPNPVDSSFVYNIDKYVNMHEQGANGGGANAADNFSIYDAAPFNIPDDPEPGIPGDTTFTTASGDYFVVEFTGFLQLPAGTVALGVNSDDGFRLSIGSGVNPRPGTFQPTILDGTRGFANTEVTLTVSQAGLYPFRLLWWENTGANSGIEFYNFAPGTTSGTRYLVNDTNQANSIRAYRETLSHPPLITFATPVSTVWIDPGGTGGPVPPAPYARVELADGTTTVNTNLVTLSLDGTTLTSTITKNGAITLITAQLPVLVSGSAHTNTVIYADSAGNTYSNFWRFVVGAYTTIPAAYSITSVDTAKPGFKVKVQMMDQNVNRHPITSQTYDAERQIADGYVDPTTSLPYANLADLSTNGPDGYFVYPDTINLNEAPANAGSFTNDSPVQGITGNPNGNNHYVSSIETILDLKAGAYRFGVNSDDGFRLTAGRGPGDVTGVQLGVANVERAPADTYVDFLVPADGFYPVRLMWFETGGGSACEFFVVDIPTGTKTLINDTTGFTPIKAYRESVASRPYISRVLPTVNFPYTFADQDVIIDITDGAITLNPGTAALSINGTAQTITAGKTNNVTTVRRASSVTNLLPSGLNTNSLTYSFTEGGNTVTVTNTWTFTVPRYLRPIPAANKVLLATDVSGSGFHVQTARQIDRSGDTNQGNGGRHTGNNMPGPEIELADGYINPTNNLPFANLLDTSTANPDGSFDVPQVLNFNNGTGGGAANAGIFNADTAVPGLPGAGTSGSVAPGLDNTVHEFQTFLDLKAGAYIFGLNVDDGWTCISAPNPRDTLGTLLGFRDGPGGQNGSPFNNPNAAFNVIVPEDGIYPFRILFWEGGGGVNLEFAMLDRGTGTQILVNDTGGAFPSTITLPGNTISPITAYNTYSGQVRPWTKFSVYPMPYIGTIQPQTTTGGNVSLWQNRNQQTGPGPINVKQPFLNGNWNSIEIQNWLTAQRPFGDAVGGVVADLGTGAVGMVLDGVSVTPTVTDIPSSTDKLVLYTPNPPLSASSNHIAGLVYAGTTNYWIFSVIGYTNVAATNILPSSTADPNAAGFHVKVVQAAAARPGNGNTVTNMEAQLAGAIANVATNGPNADGSYTIPGIINWNVQKNPGNTIGEIGNFQPLLTGTPDDPVPGIPGTNLTGTARFENISAEIFAYLDLPAGYQKFGINGDDGWKVQVGTPGQTNGTLLFSVATAPTSSTVDRGAGAADIPFAFITPQAGLVPVRLAWYQGGGGGNLEFFTYGANGTKIPVNDRNNPNSVKAYYNVITGPQLQFTSVTLAAGSLTIDWTGTGRLQEASNLTGQNTDWSDVSNPPKPYSVQVGTTAGQKFYRLISP